MTTQKFNVGDLVVTNDNNHPGLLYQVTEAHDTHVVFEGLTRGYRRVVHFYDDPDRSLQLATDKQVYNVISELETSLEQLEDSLDTLRSTLATVKKLQK